MRQPTVPFLPAIRYTEAFNMGQAALAALSGQDPLEKSPELAEAHEAVAHGALLLGTSQDLQLALGQMGHSLTIREALFGSNSLEVAACQNMLAVIYLQLNRCAVRHVALLPLTQLILNLMCTSRPCSVHNYKLRYT